jgi:geranylgeranyl diphosphate synthase, type I
MPQPLVRFPAALSDHGVAVERHVDAFLRSESDRWASVDIALVPPLDALRDLVQAGGKRLRPAFCLAGFVGAGGSPDETLILDAGAALELLHTFALVHDDVMDGSERRRGGPAIHRRFMDAHSDASWRGEARRFGEGIAILVGDIAYVYADQLAGRCIRQAGAVLAAIWDELRVELCVGQSLDLLGTAARRADLATASRIATYKSGKYTIERPLHFGATMAGAGVVVADALSAIGLPLGEAFQLRDDVLGVFGDEEATGKPVGDDLREGKPTALLAHATNAARTTAARALLERVGATDLTPTEVAAIQELITESGALANVETQIARLTADAHRAIAAAPLAPPARDWLDDLADYVAWRDR